MWRRGGSNRQKLWVLCGLCVKYRFSVHAECAEIAEEKSPTSASPHLRVNNKTALRASAQPSEQEPRAAEDQQANDGKFDDTGQELPRNKCRDEDANDGKPISQLKSPEGTKKVSRRGAKEAEPAERQQLLCGLCESLRLCVK